MTDAPASNAWSWRHAITRSDLPATTRHVLLTLSLYMSETGQSCYPKVEDLVAATGLSKRAVLMHLQAAVEAGWLWKGNHGLRGQRWRRGEYEPRWPGRGDAEAEDVECEGGASDAPPSGVDVVHDVHQLAGEGGDPRAPKVVHDVHQDKDQSRNHSIGEREGALARARSDRLEGEKSPTATADDGLSSGGQSVLEMIALYPNGRQYPRGQVEAAWNALTPDQRQRAIDELPGWLDERMAAKLRPMFLQTYLGEKQFDLPRGIGPAAKPGKGGRPAKGVTVSGGGVSFGNYSREWYGHLVWCLEHGRTPHVMVRMARGNRAGRWGCKVTELPTAEALGGFVKVSSDSEQWRAWRRWILTKAPGLGDPQPAVDHVAWLDVPSEWPPGASAQTDETDDADAYPAEMEI